MILRRITEHVKAQNWFAVALDFLIVVFGVFIGLQVQFLVLERQRQSSEQQYLIRLHDEIEQLIESRSSYDKTRPAFTASLKEAADILAIDRDDSVLLSEHCSAILGSSYTTVPPADLPTVGELLSSARLEQILSGEIRQAILDYTQDVARARDLISQSSKEAEDLARAYPSLIVARFVVNPDFPDGIWLDPVCDTPAMRENEAFMNAFSLNAFNYTIYSNRAVLPVSRQLGELHATLDKALSIVHGETGEAP